MSPPKIIFIDGPTGVGKDHFINRFVCMYQTTLKTSIVHSLRAVDVVLNKNSQSENRKYTSYNTPLELVKSIYNGHIELLTLLAKTAKELKNKKDTIIVNRSFLSYLIYNYYPALEEHGTPPTQAHRDLYSSVSPTAYAEKFKSIMTDIPTLFVNLKVGDEDNGQSLETLITRARSRQDNKPIESAWFLKLIEKYQNPPEDFKELFTYTEEGVAEDYPVFLTKYFHKH